MPEVDWRSRPELRRRFLAAAIAVVGWLPACHRSAPIPVPGSSCTADPDCGDLYFCDRTSGTCQWRPIPDAEAGGVDAVDPGGGVETAPDLPPASGSPAQLGGLVLWLDAAVGVTSGADGRVVQWRDRSSFGHLARPPGLGPVVVASAHLGKPAIGFGLAGLMTVSLRIPDHEALRWGVGDFTLAAVVRYHNAPGPPESADGYGLVFSKQIPDVRPFVGPGLFVNDPWPWFLGTGTVRTGAVFQLSANVDQVIRSTSDGYNDGAVHILSGSRHDQRLVFWIDGVYQGSLVTDPPVDVSTPGVDVVIGAHARVPEQQLEGDLFELVASRGMSAPDERPALERFLADKYSVSLGGGPDR